MADVKAEAKKAESKPVWKVTDDQRVGELFAKAFPSALKIEVVSVGTHNAVALVDGVPQKLPLE